MAPASIEPRGRAMTLDFLRISYTLVSDGSRDLSLLQHIVGWVIRQVGEYSLQIHPQVANFSSLRTPLVTLEQRLREAVRRFPCDILFVHRDAEGQPREWRVSEIDGAVREAGIDQQSVPVVPVRMTEAWLLGSEAALRTAAGNPNGKIPLAMPRVRQLEAIPDPKELLHRLLATASEKPGRRRKMFMRDMNLHVRRVAVYTEDYSHLQSLPAFRAFVEDTEKAVRYVLRSGQRTPGI